MFVNFSIDATTFNPRLGHFVNDGEDDNCEPRIVVEQDLPYVCLFSLKDIDIGTELRYQYGDQAKNLWWRKEVHYIAHIIIL